MQDPKQQISPRYSMNLEQRKTWYSPVADVYYKARAPYPQELINRAVTLAQLSSDAAILEIGCGPGNATVCFAQLGFSMICLEPNQDFYHLARHNCVRYSAVEICNTSFEEWVGEANSFNAVLAANAFNWIPPEMGYSKAAQVLQDNGCLILLWNMTPEPRFEVYQAIEEVYQAYTSSLVHYEGAETQADILRGFGQNILNSGCFRDLVSEQIACEVTYSINDFLNLLSTHHLSTLQWLEPQMKDLLFERLREKLEDFGDNIQLSYLSAVQIARKGK